MITKSESIFEEFLSAQNLEYSKVPEGTQPTPDYRVEYNGLSIFFEVKELTQDKNFLSSGLQRRVVGDHIRSKISEARKQIQIVSTVYKSPAILLVYNNIDTAQLFGTEEMDFQAAILGEPTVQISKDTLKISAAFWGKNKSFNDQKNTSFSGVGLLRDFNNQVNVTIFKNPYAAVPLEKNRLPACFEIKELMPSCDQRGG